MFELEREIVAWRNETFRRGVKRADVLDELENHLREDFKQRVSCGETEKDAFVQSLEELGDSELLKQEFSKVSQGGWMMWAHNPVMLNVAAVWLIIAGSNSFFMLLQHWRLGTSLAGAAIYIFNGFLLIVSCQALLGIGLLYRVRLARYFTLGWAGIALGLFVSSQIYLLITGGHGWYSSSLMVSTIGGTTQQPRYIFLGFSVPMIFLQIISCLNLALLLWACFSLTRPAIRQLFHARRTYV